MVIQNNKFEIFLWLHSLINSFNIQIMRETLIYLSHLDHDDTERQVSESERTGSFHVLNGNKK